eukprot:3941662-Rhodomonas_salina.3
MALMVKHSMTTIKQPGKLRGPWYCYSVLSHAHLLCGTATALAMRCLVLTYGIPAYTLATQCPYGPTGHRICYTHYPTRPLQAIGLRYRVQGLGYRV